MIIDSFLYNGEFAMLNFRLHEYNDYVDRFVIIEATHTFDWVEKELKFPKQKHLLEKFSHKIEYIVVEPPKLFRKPTMQDQINWQFYIRDEGCRNIDAAPDDILIHTDLDELWNTKNTEYIYDFAKVKPFMTCKGEWYCYDAEHKLVERIGESLRQLTSISLPFHVVVGQYNQIVQGNRGPSTFRANKIQQFDLPYSGWHFTWFDNAIGTEDKARSMLGSDARRMKEKYGMGTEGLVELAKRKRTHFAVPLICVRPVREKNFLMQYIPIEQNLNLPKYVELIHEIV